MGDSQNGKRSWASRASAYALTKLVGPRDGFVRNGADVLRAAARQALHPLPGPTQSGLRGRYADGGRSRFAEVIEQSGVTDEDLKDRRARWQTEARCLLAAAGMFMAVWVIWVMLATTLFDWLMSIGMLGGAVTLLALAFRADFSAWQIAERRFGSVRDYMDGRF